MLKRDWAPTASETAALSEGSTLKALAMHSVAVSMYSASSAVRVPSLAEVLRKSMMESARRFLESGRDLGERLVDGVGWWLRGRAYHLVD